VLQNELVLAVALWVLPGPCDPPVRLRAPVLREPVLDIGFTAPNHLLVLGGRSITSFERRGTRLERKASLDLPLPLRPIRSSAGILAMSEDGRSAWALTNQTPRAVLLGTETLDVYETAQVIPWPGAPGGLHYRSGTNQLVGDIPGLGEGPFLAVSTATTLAGRTLLALDATGQLLSQRHAAESETLELAGPLALVGPATLLASDATMPAGSFANDALIAVDISEVPRIISRCTVPGFIRAIATFRSLAPGVTDVVVVSEFDGTLRWSLMSVTE